jgi:4-hydroxybenzoate polyprenyltransferase
MSWDKMAINIGSYEDFHKYISSFLNEILYGGYYAALGSPFLILSVSFILNLKTDIPILSIAYILPLIVYSYDYYQDLDKDLRMNSERAAYLSKKTHYYPKILFIYVVMLGSLLIFFSNYKLILFILGIVIGGILYSVALKGVTSKIPLFKNIYTALTWALGGTFFIVFYYSLDITLAFLLLFLFIFLRVLINIVFFDLKDAEGDKEEGLKTLPAIFGKEKSINILYALNIISFLPLFFGIYCHLIPIFSFLLTIFYIYVFYYIKKSKDANTKDLGIISHAMADSEFVIWPIVLIIGQFIYHVSL